MAKRASRIQLWISDHSWRWLYRWRLHRLDVPGNAADTPRGTRADSEAPTENAIRAVAGDALERRRQRVEGAAQPHWDTLAANRIADHESNFTSIVQDFEGTIEDIHAVTRGGLIEADRGCLAAQHELDCFIDAAQCRRNEAYSVDKSSLRWSASAIVLVEAAAGAGVFGEYSPGGMVESFVIGGAIGGANVICGLMCAWGWQAGWRRSFVKAVATIASASLAMAITLAAAHYREALAQGARNAFERGVETFLDKPFEPLASLPLLLLAAFGGFAFLHITRTWLSIYGRVPGYRKRVLALRREQRHLDSVDGLGKSAITAAIATAKAAVETRLANGEEARLASDIAEREILAAVSQFYGEKAQIREIANQKLAQHEAIAGRSAGAPRLARTISEDFGAPPAIEDPRPAAELIEQTVMALEKARPRVVLALDRLGAAGKDFITAMRSAIARGIDIGPDLQPKASGPAPALAGGLG